MMIRKKDLKEDIGNLKANVRRLRDANDSLEQTLTMQLGTCSEITIKQVVYALLKFLELEIDTIAPNERFEIKPIKQKKGK